jgi:F-type H+-transporting ATPase subunit b
MDLEIGQIVSQIIAFFIMLWVMKRFAWKPLLGVMEERRQKIQAEFDFIEEQKNEVKKLDDEYHRKLNDVEAQGKVIIQKAISEGRSLAKDIQKEAHENAEGVMKKAQEEVNIQVAKAKVQLKTELVDMIIGVSQKVVKEDLDNEKQKKLVSAFIDEAEFK